MQVLRVAAGRRSSPRSSSSRRRARAGPAAAAGRSASATWAPLTGIFAQAGKDMLDGLKMSLEQVWSGQAGGRKIELIEEDTEGNRRPPSPSTASWSATTRSTCSPACCWSTWATAWCRSIEKDQLPTLFLTTPDDLTKRKSPKWILRSNFSASQIMHPLGDYAAKTSSTSGWRSSRWTTASATRRLGGFQRVFEDAGGRVVQKIWVPLNVLDFAPYLSQVAKDVDAVVRGLRRRPGGALRQAVRRAGLKGRNPLIGTGVMIDESALRGYGRRGGRHHRHAALEPRRCRTRPTRPS